MLKKLFPWMIGVVGLALFALAMVSDLSFQKCANDPDESSQYQQNGGSAFFEALNIFLIRSRITCIGVFIHDAHEEILAAFTIFLAIFTFLLWWATYKLARDAKNAAARQATDTQTSLATAKQAANASTDMGATMERNARYELRAYVGVQHVHIENGNGGDHRGIFVIKNFGKTMAKATVIRINGTMIIGAIAEFPLGDRDRKSKTVVMPSESLGGIEHAINPIEGQGSRIYLWGRIDYKDVFGFSHWTLFRFVDYKKTFSESTGLHTGWDVKTCAEGNDAGDD